jgi:hypothetical protein
MSTQARKIAYDTIVAAATGLPFTIAPFSEQTCEQAADILADPAGAANRVECVREVLHLPDPPKPAPAKTPGVFPTDGAGEAAPPPDRSAAEAAGDVPKPGTDPDPAAPAP